MFDVPSFSVTSSASIPGDRCFLHPPTETSADVQLSAVLQGKCWLYSHESASNDRSNDRTVLAPRRIREGIRPENVRNRTQLGNTLDVGRPSSRQRIFIYAAFA